MIRPSKPEDLPEIRSLLEAAFAPSTFESYLMDWVSRSGESHYGWVAESGSRIMGYILYTTAFDGSEPVGYHLAPVAVHPDFQRRGIASKLIGETLAAEPIFPSAVFVLGDPAFYERFGFKTVGIPACPYDPGNRHFRALRWAQEGEPFVIGYSRSFIDAERGAPPDSRAGGRHPA